MCETPPPLYSSQLRAVRAAAVVVHHTRFLYILYSSAIFWIVCSRGDKRQPRGEHARSLFETASIAHSKSHFNFFFLTFCLFFVSINVCFNNFASMLSVVGVLMYRGQSAPFPSVTQLADSYLLSTSLRKKQLQMCFNIYTLYLLTALHIRGHSYNYEIPFISISLHN